MSFKQETFNKAYYLYMDECSMLKQLAVDTNIDQKKLLYGYEIIMQLALCQMILLDGRVTDVEIEFLKNIVVENDILKILSKKNGQKIGWSMIDEIDDKNKFLHKVIASFTPEILEFITLFVSSDAITKEDYLNTLKGNIYLICQNLLASDGLDTLEEDAYKVLNNILFKKMDDLKSIAIKAQELKFGQNLA